MKATNGTLSSRLRGFCWRLGMYRETPCLNLIAPSGKQAATVFLHFDVFGFNWFVWDEHGVGGENSKEPEVQGSMRQAEDATRRWGKHEGRMSNPKGKK